MLSTQVECSSDQNFGRPLLGNAWDLEVEPRMFLDRIFKRFLKNQARKRHSKVGRRDRRTKLAMPSKEVDRTSFEALAALIGRGRRGHGGRSAAEGRPSGPPSSATCSRRTPAPVAVTLAEARRQALSSVREPGLRTFRFFQTRAAHSYFRVT